MPEGLLIAYLRLQSLVWAHKTPGVVSPTVEWLDRRWGEIQEIITIETSAYDPDINFQSGDFFQSVATLQSKEREREEILCSGVRLAKIEKAGRRMERDERIEEVRRRRKNDALLKSYVGEV